MKSKDTQKKNVQALYVEIHQYNRHHKNISTIDICDWNTLSGSVAYFKSDNRFYMRHIISAIN